MAYLRFASVYRGFETLADFEAEIERLGRSAPPSTGLMQTRGRRG
ncbi:hypothetical protein GCM10018952_73730 [Streptosporangium vulgare]